LLPWFLVLFVAFAAINSLGWLTQGSGRTAEARRIRGCCASAWRAWGLQTSFADVGRAGVAPIAAGTAQWLLLATLSYGLAYALCR
jgi:uncharacterized membrane protein YadS